MDDWGAEMLQFESRIDSVFIPPHGLGYEILRALPPDSYDLYALQSNYFVVYHMYSILCKYKFVVYCNLII